jgi:hypothetical protein
MEIVRSCSTVRHTIQVGLTAELYQEQNKIDAAKSSARQRENCQWAMTISDVLDMQNPGLVHGAVTTVLVGRSGKINVNA